MRRPFCVDGLTQCVRLGHRARLHVPDAGCILGDGAVAGELSRAGHIQDRLARPGIRVGIQLDTAAGPPPGRTSDPPGACSGRRASAACRASGAKMPGSLAAEVVGRRSGPARLAFPVRCRSASAGCTSCGCSATCSAVRPNRKKFSSPASSAISIVAPSRVPMVKRSVHHELHVARAAGLVAGGRDLIGHVAGRNQPFGERHIVLGQKQDLDSAAHRRVAVDGLARLLMNLMMTLARW